MGNYDRVVIQSLLKEVAQTQQLDLAAKQKFKVVVINEADQLSRDAQAALRRTMEKYSPNLRLILIATSTANIIPPIRSRTLLVRVAAPTAAEITTVLTHVAKLENLSTPPKGLCLRISAASGRNLRKALLILESIYAQNDVVMANTPIPPADYEALIAKIAEEILADHTPARILAVRAKFYDLLTHCIPATVVLRGLALRIVEGVDECLRAEVIRWAAFYEHRLHTGAKVVFHLEAFVAKVMRILERYVCE